MRDMLMLALSSAGYRVVQAEDGMHGLEVLQGEVPDVIVTDINMPRMDGFGFIEGVRRDVKHRAIPILVLTTESDAEKKDRARRAGATGWIVKPFDPVKLVDAIRRVAA
jgi:two-component system chemotaxis response regulator CheY